jgi:hypothetical protein
MRVERYAIAFLTRVFLLSGESIKIKIVGFLLSVVAPLLVSCTSNSNADTPLPTVSYSVIALGASTIHNLPVNRKLEIYTDQTSFNASLYLFIQPLAEHTVDFSSRRVAFADYRVIRGQAHEHALIMLPAAGMPNSIFSLFGCVDTAYCPLYRLRSLTNPVYP